MAATLLLFGAAQAAVAQDVENGRRLSERWCSECHAIGPVPAKLYAAPPFAAIAARETINVDMIATFLLLPHATMPNLPLSRNDARDIARFIIEMRK
ncbi:cytochrome C [Bradyrhizobium sp. C9]|nr:cytochrome C [Bradyrhizobium sp. C9]